MMEKGKSHIEDFLAFRVRLIEAKIEWAVLRYKVLLGQTRSGR